MYCQVQLELVQLRIELACRLGVKVTRELCLKMSCKKSNTFVRLESTKRNAQSSQTWQQKIKTASTKERKKRKKRIKTNHHLSGHQRSKVRNSRNFTTSRIQRPKLNPSMEPLASLQPTSYSKLMRSNGQ